MIRTELFKVRHHRTPRVLLTVLTASTLIVPAYFATQRSANAVDLVETFGAVFAVAGSLLATVFGGWIVGHEYRQGTLRRVVGSDARRPRLVATKAMVGFVSLLGGLLLAASIGSFALMASAASIDSELALETVARDILGAVFISLVTATIAFGLSLLLRSDTYAMLGSLAVMVIVGPLLGLIPTIGRYTPPALTENISDAIRGVESFGDPVSVVPASIVLASTLAGLVVAATASFQQRDI